MSSRYKSIYRQRCILSIYTETLNPYHDVVFSSDCSYRNQQRRGKSSIRTDATIVIRYEHGNSNPRAELIYDGHNVKIYHNSIDHIIISVYRDVPLFIVVDDSLHQMCFTNSFY